MSLNQCVHLMLCARLFELSNGWWFSCSVCIVCYFEAPFQLNKFGICAAAVLDVNHMEKKHAHKQQIGGCLMIYLICRSLSLSVACLPICSSLFASISMKSSDIHSQYFDCDIESIFVHFAVQHQLSKNHWKQHKMRSKTGCIIHWLFPLN